MAGKTIMSRIKNLVIAIPVAILVLFVYVQCSKVGSELIMETPGVRWYVSDKNYSKDDLLSISQQVNSLLIGKNIDTKDFGATLILCNSTSEYMWKSLVLDEKSQGVTRAFLGHVIINKSSIKDNQMLGFDNSTLSNIIAHELSHIYVEKKLSVFSYLFLESWKNEGFSEYVAEHSTFDVDHGLSLFLANNKAEIEKTELSKNQFFYFASRLKADYLLGHKRVSFEEFMKKDYNEEALENEIRNALKSGEYEFLR